MEELNSFKEKEVYEVVDKPLNKNLVEFRWVFDLKRNVEGKIMKYKARLVAKGYIQIEGMGYYLTYSPILKADTKRLF